MSLRRRIAAAAALVAAVVAAAIGGIGYASTRSHLIGEVQRALLDRAKPYLQEHPRELDQLRAFGGQKSGAGPIGARGLGPFVPPAPANGGAPGVFQFVHADGTVTTAAGGAPQLPVD